MRRKHVALALLIGFCLGVVTLESRPYDRVKDAPPPSCNDDADDSDMYECLDGNMNFPMDFGQETSWPTNFEDSFYDSLTK